MSLIWKSFLKLQSEPRRKFARDAYKFWRRKLPGYPPNWQTFRREHKIIKKLTPWEYDNLTDNFRIIYVEPDKITVHRNKFHKYWDAGAIYSGDWDKQTFDISKHPKYRGIQERFVDGKSWENTCLFSHYIAKLSNDEISKGCSNMSDLINRYELIDDLFEKIESEGVKPKRKVVGQNDVSFTSYYDDICVHIGRDGEYIFMGNGFHRFSIAKILDLEKIPVRVVVRHPKWQKIRIDVLNDSHQHPEHWEHSDIKSLVNKPN